MPWSDRVWHLPNPVIIRYPECSRSGSAQSPSNWPGTYLSLPAWRKWRCARQDEHEKEYRIVRPDGEIRWIRDRSFPIQNETGQVYRVVGIAEDISDRKQAEDKLKSALLEKETLLKEIHHRVKNNLQVISSLLRLQSRQIREQQTLELFKESQNRVQAMALIHEKLYQSSNLAQIDFRDYITTLVGNLCRSYDTQRQAVTFKINVKQVSVAIDTAIPCGLIINELLTNSEPR